MSANVVGHDRVFGASGHRANYSGGANVHGEGVKTAFGYLSRAESREKQGQHHSAPGSQTYGITCLKPCKEDGEGISEPQRYELQYGGRTFRPNSNGVFRMLDTSAYNSVIANRMDYDAFLAQYSAYIKGGDEVFRQIFGDEALQQCAPHGDGKTQYQHLPDGTRIAPGLACLDCTPDIFRQIPDTADPFPMLLSKCMQIVGCYKPVNLGDLPSWDPYFSNAGERTDPTMKTATDAAGNQPPVQQPPGPFPFAVPGSVPSGSGGGGMGGGMGEGMGP